MPILRADHLLIYFAHVPKCAGSAMEQYLHARFGAPAFLDKSYSAQPKDRRWSASSPQHISTEVLDRLFPPGFFDYSFTIVRHPLTRIVSAFHFQVEIEKSLPATAVFSDWLRSIPGILEKDPFAFDNHIRPMVDLVPEDAHVAYLEHGLESLITWFDTITGRMMPPRAIPQVNVHADRAPRKGVILSDDDRALIARIYAKDLERFEYNMEDPMPRIPAPTLSAELIAARAAEAARHNHVVNRFGRHARQALRS